MHRDVRVSLLWASIAGLLAVLAVSGCSKKEPVEGPVFPSPEGVTIAGRVISWQTDQEARAVVRYGVVRDHLDHVAYPAAAGRRDRAFVTDHQVALLDLSAGHRVYYQLGAETRLSGLRFAAIDSFTATVGVPSGLLTSTMVHIGFGDCHVLTMPLGKRILIDAGYRDAAPAVEEYLADHGIEAIDFMLATHVHEDHMGGIVGYSENGVLATHEPSVFFDSPRKDAGQGKRAYSDLQRMLSAEVVDTQILHRFDSSATVASLQWDPSVSVLVLNSGTPDGYVSVDYEGTDINNESIVLRISYGDVDMVLGGDAERESEASMIAAFAGWDLNTEYYKASHHGLNDASSAAWVNTLQPRVCFIPNTAYSWDGNLNAALGATMSTLAGVSAHVYAIDDTPLIGEPRSDGIQHNITFATDGVSYEVRVERARQVPPPKRASSAACIRDDPDLRDLFPDDPPAAGGSHQE